MKKFYVLLVCTCAATLLHAQTWIGGATGNWSVGTNWSGGTVPNSTGASVLFNTDANVLVDIANISLGSIQVTNNATVKLHTISQVTVTLNSTSAVSPALQIDGGSTLIDSVEVNGTTFDMKFANDAKGRVSGTWYFSGATGSPGGLATFSFPSSTTLTNVVDVFGGMVFAGTAFPPLTPTASYLIFHSGSTFYLNANRNTPLATWDPNSTITIANGNIDVNTFQVGNLTIDMPGLAANRNISLPNNMEIQGDFNILNTNGFTVNLTALAGPILYTVDKSMTVSGTSKVVFANSSSDAGAYTLDVKGNFNMSGTSFLLRNTAVTSLTFPTVLKVGGSFNHTAGTFGNNAAASSTSVELYAVELDGVLTQNVGSVTGTIDDVNNQVILRLNNPGGATLTTPLSVGKISWSSGKGILNTTSTNILTINNARDSVADPLVVNAAGAATGYVNGPVRRKVGTVGGYVFPTGSATTYRPVVISPTVTTASGFDAQYFPTGHPDPSVQPPLNGISNSEYWTVSTAPASPAINATIQLSLNGTPVSGAGSSQSVVVAAYGGPGTGWVNAAGSQLSPGNSSTGSVISAARNTFGAFTFGYGVIGALPIHLLNFDAKKSSSSSATVSWSITPSSTPSYFEVLRSPDGSHFTKAGIVSGVRFVYDYRFTDNNLGSGTTYYRLNMVDQSGSSILSKIVAVVNSAKGVVMSSMMPTVVINSARINVSSSQNLTLQLVVTDMNGRVIQRQMAGITAGSNQEVRMNLQSLAAGAYQVTGYAAGEMIGTIRFVKQ